MSCAAFTVQPSTSTLLNKPLNLLQSPEPFKVHTQVTLEMKRCFSFSGIQIILTNKLYHMPVTKG